MKLNMLFPNFCIKFIMILGYIKILSYIALTGDKIVNSFKW